MTKWPRVGRAKRRLALDVGRFAARDLARAFLRDTLAVAQAARPDQTLIVFAPRAARHHFARLAPRATLVAQPRTGFGPRLAYALGAGIGMSRAVVLIATDAPTLRAASIGEAFESLESGRDLVLGPSDDGGYYLIGCRAPLPPSLFAHMPWSTAAVLQITLQRARSLGIDVALLEPWYDVDDEVSLGRLRADAAGLSRAAHTARALRDLDLIR
ncbi:MAG: TIGR04282 family arsenosugar biosynthesis glycosyltransferase [Candidatus Limnocylindria bacterium]